MNLEGIFFGKKGQVFQAYLAGAESYKVAAERLGIKHCTQLKVWVRKYRNGEPLDTRKGSSSPMKGRPPP